jgi:membrane associated rhomboid family serine protease
VRPVRTAPTQSQAEEWALVLTAAGIPNEVESEDGAWAVFAAPDDTARAEAALAAYDEERRDRVPVATAAEPYPWMSGAVLALLLLWLFSVTSGRPWAERGTAAAAAIGDGEVWRTVTALTLHADLVHVAGNAVAVAVLFPPLVQRFGAGAALLLLLASGAVGNLLAAMIHDERHVAVGSSTAIFGAVGILGALRLLPREAPASRKRWTAPVAGVVLLVLLGAARGADLAAHALGFGTGVVAGLAAGVTVHRRPGAIVQWLLGGLAALAVLGSWRLALR